LSEQGDCYASFVEAELKREFERKDKLDARSSAAVIGSGGLLAVAVAGLAVVKGKDFTLEGVSAILLAVGLLLFLAASLLGSLASLNWKYEVATADTLSAMIESHWVDTEPTAKNSCARLHISTIASLRPINNWRALLLACSVWAQTGAIAALAGTVYLAVR
jgi:hypothetical protein